MLEREVSWHYGKEGRRAEGHVLQVLPAVVAAALSTEADTEVVETAAIVYREESSRWNVNVANDGHHEGTIVEEIQADTVGPAGVVDE